MLKHPEYFVDGVHPNEQGAIGYRTNNLPKNKIMLTRLVF